ncbi:MAG: IS1 family transposase [Desulfuromonadales bacterium]|nr:IS1 family transposase [Desulfuromonadales bacterium]
MQKEIAFIETVMKSFSPAMLETETVTRWLVGQVHPGGPVCPVCGESVTGEAGLRNFYALKRVQCKKCNNHSNAAAGTVLHGLKFDIRFVFLMALLIGAGMSYQKIGEILKLQPRTVQIWSEKFAQIGQKG